MPQSWFDQFQRVDEPPPRAARTSWFDQFQEVDAPTTYDDEFGRPVVPASRVVGPREERALGPDPVARARRTTDIFLPAVDDEPPQPETLRVTVDPDHLGVVPSFHPPEDPRLTAARVREGRLAMSPEVATAPLASLQVPVRPTVDALPATQPYDPLAPPPPLPSTSFAEAVGRGVDVAQMLVFGALEATGEALGMESLITVGREGRHRNEAQMASGAPRSAFTEIRSSHDFGQWAKETIGEQIPIMAPMLAGGATGAVVGSVVPGVGTTLGALVGAFVPSLVMGVGEVQAEIKARDPSMVAPGMAFRGGTAIAALDSVLPGRIGGRLVRTLGREAAEEVATRMLLRPVSPSLVRRTATGATSGMATESVTEALQEAIADVAAASATGGERSPTLGREMVEAGAAGGLLGLVGGTASSVPGPRAVTAQAQTGPVALDAPVSEAPPSTGRPTPAAQPSSWFDQFQEAGDSPLAASPPPSPGARVEEEIDIARPAGPLGAPVQGVLADRVGEAPPAVDRPDADEARKSVRAPQVTREALGPPETRELRRIAAELEAFPFAGKTFREAGPGRGGDLEVQGRTPGAPVYWDIVGGTPERGRPVFRYSRGQVAEKLQAFLQDGTRSVVSDLAVDVAKRRLRGDPTVRTPALPPEAGDPRIQVTPLEGLSDADAAVQARAIRAVEANPEGLAEQYEARFGKIVGADHAKTLLGENYADPERRTRHTQAVHQPSSTLAHHIFETRMQAAQPGDLILMLSGGPGSGKTTSLRGMPGLSDVAHTVYDSNLTRRDGATRDIETALEAGLEVGIVHVLRDPVVAFQDGVLPRANTQGRIVTIDQHVRNHGQARETFRVLQAQYADNDRVGFTVIDNRGSAPEMVGVDVLNQEEYDPDDVRRRISHALEDAHAAGRISDAVYAATRKSFRGVEESGRRGDPPIQRIGRQVARLGRVAPPPTTPPATQSTTRRPRPLVLTKNPAGTWSFAGSVPKDLAYADRETGDPISDEDAAQVAQHGPGLFRARIRSLTWPTQADALAAARALGIDEVDGADGKNIPTAPAREERTDTDDEPPPTGGGSGAASVGTFAPARPGRATTTPARPETIHPIEFPELVDLARRLQRTPKVVRAFRKDGQVGEFRPGSIRLAADLFKRGHEQQLAKTLAHEIGHLLDWLPTPTLKRGNILGRLRSLRSYLNGTFTGPDGTTIKNTAIRNELTALSATWRPWNRATSPARFRQYRDSARELYADAVSVLLNDPEMLKRDAPQFAQAFFDGLDAKPDVKQAYFDLQEQLSGTRVDLVARRRAGSRRMWHEGDVKALELEQLRQAQTTQRRQHLWFRLRHELLDKHTTFIDRVHELEQRGVTINPDDDPRYLLSERNYLGGKLKGFVEEQFAPIHQEILESGVGWATFGELLFYDRIVAGDRSDVANPKGLSPADATELRDRVIADLGPARARVATAAADQFRAVVKDVATQAHAEGLYTDELFTQMQANPAYVTFQVIDHMETGVTSRVYRQMGTLKSIAHPADATVLKTLVTLRAIEHNKVKRKGIELLHQHFPEDIAAAKTVWSGTGHRPIESKDPDTHLVRYFQDGRVVGVYVDQYIADALENNSVGQNLMVIQLLQMVNGRYFRPVFTTFNLGFQTFNLARDVGRFWKATPQLRGTGIGDTLLRYWQAVPMAKVRAFGLSARPSAKELAAYRDLIDSENAGILSITYNDFILGRELEDTQMEDVLARLGVTTFTPKPHRMVFRPFIQMLDAIKEVGDFIETLPKGAGIYHFRGDGEIADISAQDRAFIRERMGSPDFLAGGTAKAAQNNLLLFSNAIFQAVRSDLKTATEPRTRAGFWWKTATANLLPKAVMFLALAGLLGPDLKRLFQKVSEYDRTNYIPVPVGVDAHDNVIYIRIPQDDMGRLIGGLFWKALQVARDEDVFWSLGQLADYSAGQFPSVAPVFEAGLSTVQFVSGRNPYDAFRGRYVFTEDEFKARDWRTVKKFIGWQFQQLGGGIVWKFYPGEQRPRERTPAQKVLELPVVSNIIGRFVRITNYGEIEAFRGVQRQAARGDAQRRLTENEAINEAIRAYLELPADRQTNDERNTLAHQLTRALYDAPRERADRENPIRTKLRIGILRGEADPLVDTLLAAGSNNEKVAILDAARDTMAEDAFEAWLAMAVDQRIISREVRADVLRRADAREAVEAGAGR